MEWKGTVEGYDGDEPVYLNYVYLGWKRRTEGYLSLIHI